MKKYVIVINGGDTWNTNSEYINYLKRYDFTQDKFDKLMSKRWKDHLQNDLGDEFMVVRPDMPCARNAKYIEWKIWFEKMLPYFKNNIILVGHSLGANFLAKYLAKNIIPCNVAQVHLVAGCYGSGGGFELPDSLSGIQNQCAHIFIYHSTDDPIVPYGDALKYKSVLPQAKLISFADRGHFLQDNFPEIVENVKKF